MQFTTKVQLLSLELCLLLPVTATAQPMQATPVVLRVSLFDDAGVGATTLREAAREANRIFQRANIDVIWLQCPQDSLAQTAFGRCSEASFPAHLHLRIALRSHGANKFVVGMSFLSAEGEGCYADLFYEPVLELQRENHIGAAIILGHAMAHELGHLLLGTNSHSRYGLMRAQWNRNDLAQAARTNLSFSPEESTRMRSRFTQDDPRTETAQME
jgi:hypothetical protein